MSRRRMCVTSSTLDLIHHSIDFGRSMSEKRYTRDELQRAQGWPEHGSLCPKCEKHIPQFAELSESLEMRIKQLAIGGRTMMAIAELRAATGCPTSWAKLWVSHLGRPDSLGTTAPCPYCGKPLRTALAKQCFHCNNDWHVPATSR